MILSFKAKAEDYTFTKDIKPLVIKRCTPCHTGQLPSLPNFTIFSESYNKRFFIKARVKGKTMPPGNGTNMTKAERQIIIDWVDQGAKKVVRSSVVNELACPAPKVFNESNEPMNETNDLKAFVQAHKTCKLEYSPVNPCLKKFWKKEPQVYWALCGPKEEK
jgi:hypothetical protein